MKKNQNNSHFPVFVDCTNCEGTGQVETEYMGDIAFGICLLCNGSGRIRNIHTTNGA